MSELEKCVCGGETEIYHYKKAMEKPFSGICLKCPSCSSRYDTKDEAIAAWNTMQRALKGNMELAEQREQIALNFLGTLNSNDVISYADYSYLHDAVSGILAAAMPDPPQD